MPSAETTCIFTLVQRFLSASIIFLVGKSDILKLKAYLRDESTRGGKHLYFLLCQELVLVRSLCE